MQFTRVTFGVACSPFLLCATIRHHLNQYDSANLAVSELNTNLYADDWLTGADTVEGVQELCNTGSAVMANARMQLTKWRCSMGAICSQGTKQVPDLP